MLPCLTGHDNTSAAQPPEKVNDYQTKQASPVPSGDIPYTGVDVS
jgi:hypothetical protein